MGHIYSGEANAGKDIISKGDPGSCGLGNKQELHDLGLGGTIN